MMSVSRLGFYHHRHLWRYFQAPKFLDRHFVAVKCRAHFCATATSKFGSGLSLPLLGLNMGLRGPSEAQEAPEAPQRPVLGHNLSLRGPSEAPKAPQRPLLDHILDLKGPSEAPKPLRGPSEAPLGSQFGPQEAWVSFWAWEGGGTAVAQIFVLRHNVAAVASLKNFLPQNVTVDRAVYPPPKYLFRHKNGQFSAQ